LGRLAFYEEKAAQRLSGNSVPVDSLRLPNCDNLSPIFPKPAKY